MRRITRFTAVILAAFALPIRVSPVTARADFQYDFRLVGTIVEINDLSGYNDPRHPQYGEQVHLLPSLHVGDPIEAMGTLTTGEDGGILHATFDAGHFATPPDWLSLFGFLLDPADPDQGFFLNIGGVFSSRLDAPLPNTGLDYEIFQGASINGPEMDVQLRHASRQLAFLDPTFQVHFASIDLTAVPEPGSLALLAIGLAGGWGLLKRRTYQNRHAA